MNVISESVGKKLSEFNQIRLKNIIDNGNTAVIDFNENGLLKSYIVLPNLTSSEIENIRHGKLRYKIAFLKNVIFFCFKFGELKYVDMPFSIHLTQSKIDFSNYDNDNDLGQAICFHLIDSATLITQGLRMIGLHAKSTIELYKIIEIQKKSAFTLHNYDSSIQEIYSRMSSREIADTTNIGGIIDNK